MWREWFKIICKALAGISHLSEVKFPHNFKDRADPMCDCGADIDKYIYFFLPGQFFSI